MHEENGIFEGFPPTDEVSVSSEHPVLQTLKDRIEYLENLAKNKDIATDSWRTIANRRLDEKTQLESNLRNVIVEMFNEGRIDQTNAERIFSECGLEATKEVSFSGSLNFSGSVIIPLFTDETDISYNTDIEGLEVTVFGEYARGLDFDLEDVNVESIS